MILLIPLVAMQFTSEVGWTTFDFAVVALLLLSAALTYETARALLNTRRQRVIAGIVVLAVVALVWVEMAVGVFGSPIAGS